MAGRREVGLGFACALAVMAGPAVGTALAAPQIYWGNFGSGTIGAANSDGSDANQSFMTGFASGEPIALAVDGEHLYWANRDTGKIGEADLDGTVVNPSLISGIQGVNAIAVNAGHIYWANALTNTIGEANLDGTGANASFITGAAAPFGLAVDGQHLYWTNISTDTVGEANLDGTGVNQSLVTGAQGISGIALDGDRLFWGNSTTQTIGEANLDGTDVNETFVTGAGNVLGVAVDGDHLVWSNFGATGTIGSAPLDGGSGQLGFISGASYPLALAVSVPVADVSPASPSPFADTAAGSVSGATTLTVTNTGQAPLLFTGASLSLTGADPGDFVIDASGCAGAVAPGASCQIEVRFSPQGVGARSATLHIASNDYANGPVQVSLSGTGTPAPVNSTPPQGPTTPLGSGAPVGAQTPAAKLDLVICRTVTRTVSRKAKGTTREVKVKQQKCSHRPLSGSVGKTRGAVRATISRGRVKYAVGTGVQLTGGRSQLVLTELRPLRPGSYTLTLRKRTSTITLG
jgi:virginiamycin B lyase